MLKNTVIEKFQKQTSRKFYIVCYSEELDEVSHCPLCPTWDVTHRFVQRLPTLCAPRPSVTL